jgi:cytoskeletal protein CcmA (bactofilin family)
VWKKNEDSPTSPLSFTEPPTPTHSSTQIATLGPSIVIQGDLTGAEDLVILGRVEGEVRLRENNVTVGRSGQIKADIHGKSIRVEGEVRGNLHGDQEVVIRASGRVQGNIVSPRVTLENGSKFKGTIDMEPATSPEAVRQPTSNPEQQKRSTSKAIPEPQTEPARPTASGGASG